jgi:dTDP-glucose 4,6-dehydratase
MIFVTGGAGFIGSNFILEWLGSPERGAPEPVLNIDCLTYAGNPDNLNAVGQRPDYLFERLDICAREQVLALLQQHRPRAIVHFAAESHVDRSILGPAEFVRTNIEGTFSLLEAARAYWGGLAAPERDAFRFLHVSTDEVYGSLGPDDPAFTETTPYQPNSPYSASKAASDHLVRAYHHTYGLPTLTTNCSNNYGPFQFPEKLIPLMIANALAGQAAAGLRRRHERARLAVRRRPLPRSARAVRGRPGETYNVGGNATRCQHRRRAHRVRLLDECTARRGRPARALITYVKDRPGHDHQHERASSWPAAPAPGCTRSRRS